MTLNDLVKSGGVVSDVARKELLDDFAPGIVRIPGLSLWRWTFPANFCWQAEVRNRPESMTDLTSSPVSENLDLNCAENLANPADKEALRKVFANFLRTQLADPFLNDGSSAAKEKAAARAELDKLADSILEIRKSQPQSKILLIQFQVPDAWATVVSQPGGSKNRYLRYLGNGSAGEKVTKSRIRNYALFMVEYLRFLNKHLSSRAINATANAQLSRSIDLLEILNEPDSKSNTRAEPKDFAQLVYALLKRSST